MNTSHGNLTPVSATLTQQQTFPTKSVGGMKQVFYVQRTIRLPRYLATVIMLYALQNTVVTICTISYNIKKNLHFSNTM
jgi:hypothetical protein